MFHNIPTEIHKRMQFLEEIDARDRRDGTPRLERLRQIPAETGRFIALVAANAPAGRIIEIGTSAGYSTLWLCLAARASDRTVTTFEVLPEKVSLAQETFREAEVEDLVELIEGDARAHLQRIKELAFCFLDAEKEHYEECYNLVVSRLVSGGVLLADNVISHKSHLQAFLDMAEADPRVDSQVVPIGKGVLFCRRT